MLLLSHSIINNAKRDFKAILNVRVSEWIDNRHGRHRLPRNYCYGANALFGIARLYYIFSDIYIYIDFPVFYVNIFQHKQDVCLAV